MQTKDATIGDYKKWLLYSFENQDFQTHYHLIKALKSGEDFGAISITTDESPSGKQFTISHGSIKDVLVIDEGQRKSFIKYLVDYYFESEDVDHIMVEKRQDSEKRSNHNLPGNASYTLSADEHYRVQQHPKEKTYYTIKLLFSIIVYVVLAGYVLYTASTSILSAVLLVISLAAIVFGFWLLRFVAKGLFVGMIRGNSIRVTKDQYPDIYAIVEEQARSLKIEQMPEIYITCGHFNAFVTRFTRRDILMIYSEVVETSLRGSYDVLKYVTAHELCHIKQKHLSKRTLLMPSAIIPFLSLAYSRACEYTCDRTGFHFSPKGAIEGVLVMTVGKEIHSRFNVERHLDDMANNAGFWIWFSEKFLTHPHMYNRLLEIRRFSTQS